MTRVLRLYADDTIITDAGAVQIHPDRKYGIDAGYVVVDGDPADLIRLSDALRQAALRAIDAKVAASEVAS